MKQFTPWRKEAAAGFKASPQPELTLYTCICGTARDLHRTRTYSWHIMLLSFLSVLHSLLCYWLWARASICISRSQTVNNFSLFHGDPLFNHTKNTASAAIPVLSSVSQCLKGEERQSNQEQMDELKKKRGKTSMERQRKRGFWRGEVRGGVGGSPGGWMRGNEEEAVNFTLKLWWESSACDKGWNRDGGGVAGLSGPLSTERWRLKQRAGVCQRGCVLLRRRKDGEDSAPRSSSEDCTSSSAASEPRRSFLLLFSPLLSISCCFLGQNCRIVGKNVSSS